MWRVLSLLIAGVVGGYIEGSVNVLNFEKLGLPANTPTDLLLSTLQVTAVRGGKKIASVHVNSAGKFGIQVDDGKYTLYFSHPTLSILPVTARVEGEITKGFLYDTVREEQVSEVPYPFVVSPVSNNSPYVPEEHFDAMQLFKNPMVIVGLLMLGMVYVMPMLQGNMSPEEMQEMRKGLEQDGGFAANLLKNMIPASNAGADAAKSVPSISSNSENRRRK